MERSPKTSVDLAASAAFTDLGVHRTRDRTGVLVFVSAFERRAVARPDIGVPVRELGESWNAWCEKLDASFRTGRRDEFVAALAELGGLLEAKLPKKPDDQNELPDDVSEKAE